MTIKQYFQTLRIKNYDIYLDELSEAEELLNLNLRWFTDFACNRNIDLFSEQGYVDLEAWIEEHRRK